MSEEFRSRLNRIKEQIDAILNFEHLDQVITYCSEYGLTSLEASVMSAQSHLHYTQITMVTKLRRDGFTPEGIAHQLKMDIKDVIAITEHMQFVGAIMSLDRRIEDIGFTKRLVTILSVGHVYTIRDLVKLSETDLFKMPDLGRKSMNEIKEFLGYNNLHLGMA